MSIYQSKQIYLNSKHASQKVNGQTSDCIFAFNDAIIIQQGLRGTLKVVSCQIPVSFYMIQGKSFKFTISGGVEEALSIPDGNYTILQLLNIINTSTSFTANSISGTYDKSTNRTTFTATSSSLEFTVNDCSILPMIGFTNTPHTAVGGKILGDRGVDVIGIKAISVNSNFITRDLS